MGCVPIHGPSERDDTSCVSATMAGASMSIFLAEPTAGTQCTAQPIECLAPFTGPSCNSRMWDIVKENIRVYAQIFRKYSCTCENLTLIFMRSYLYFFINLHVFPLLTKAL